jgi:Acetyltransferase (GNAT) domain
MDALATVDKVMEAVQSAKSGATDFRTNFFSVPRKLQAWMARDELLGTVCDGAAFFFRKDHDFWHFYFCAANLTALARELTTLSELTTRRVVADLVGSKAAVGDLVAVLQSAGFRPYARLERMSRAAWRDEPRPAQSGCEVVFAEKADRQAILSLIESEFDRYAEQPPMLWEVQSAIEQRQILAVKWNGKIGGVLFFETLGLASTIRFWVVDKECRALRIGSALMLHYLTSQIDVRRFTLWVNSCNEKAIQKYAHYGYVSDGLVDQVLANQMIPA